MYEIKNFINGKIASSSDKKLEIFNPSKGEVQGLVVNSDEDDFERTVKSSLIGYEKWSKVTPLNRSRILSKYKDNLLKDINNIANLVSKEHGKTHDDALGSITRGIEVVEYAVGIPELLKGEFSQNVGTGIDSWSYRYPLGICAGITPFNFPAMVPMWMYPLSIACGNSFILKPSEKNPSCAIRLAELFIEAGLPEGVFNVINGDKNIVNKILNDKRISSVSFVGSTSVAKYIYETSAKNSKRVQALGGAKNHLVVMPDADIEQASNGIIGAAFGSAGERCMAVSVAVAVGDIADKLVENITEKARNLKVAPWESGDSDMGPLISKEHLIKVKNYISDGISSGAKLILDGREIKIQGYEDGYFIGPSIFDNVTSEMNIYKDEIFGPVLGVVRVKNYEEAVNLINSHIYGNGTSIYTSNGEISRDFTTNINIGMVGVNVPIPVPMAFHSFGGWKESSFGSNGMHGREGVNFYTKLKTVTSRWPKNIESKPEFKMPTN